MDEMMKEAVSLLRTKTKLVFDRRDIAVLEGISLNQASKICKLLRDRYGGAIAGRPNAVRADSYYRYCGWEDYSEIMSIINKGAMNESIQNSKT